MISRRAFIKGLGIVSLPLLLPQLPSLASSVAKSQVVPKSPHTFFPDTQLLSAYLKQYSLPRQCLMYDDLPDGCIPRYLKDHPEYLGDSTKAYVLDGDQKNLRAKAVYGGEVYAPKIEFERDDIESNEDVCQWLAGLENDGFLKLLSRTDQVVTCLDEWNLGAINEGFRCIEKHDAVVHTMIMNGKTMEFMESLGTVFWDTVSFYDKKIKPLMTGRLWSADVLSIEHPKLENKIYILSYPETIGAFAFSSYLATFGYYKEDIGMSLINPYLVSRIELVKRNRR